jgi:GAF domain-containing protein
MSEDGFRAAVAAGVLGADDAHRELLQAIVDVTRAIFGAKAASIFLFDEQTNDLIFEAVSGHGEDSLVGRRFPAGTGIAGSVLATRQPIVVEDLSEDPRFARQLAVSTGYLPKGLMAAPLLYGDRALGVLEVLDRPQNANFSLHEMDLLGLFANQAAIALDLVQRNRRAGAALVQASPEFVAVARIASALEGLPGNRRDALVRTLSSLADALSE